MSRLVTLTGMLLILGVPLTAQSTPTTPETPSTILPYKDEEFEPWVLQLRRAEIIAIGAFPLAYLFAGLGYDYVFYLSSGFPQENAPWPVGPGTSQWTMANQPDRLPQKNLTLVGVALATGVLLATVDWMLGW